MKFPSDWPSGCPPIDTPDAVGEFFRIVKDEIIAESDFLSHHETKRLPKADPCLRCGLSVFGQLVDALHQQQLMPRLGKAIAVAHLEPTCGKAVSTPGQQPSHTTWWPYEGIVRSSYFALVKVT